MPNEALTLYRLEDDLAAMIETGEAGIEPELEEQYRATLSTALQNAIEKRDRVAQFIRFLENQAQFAGEEAKRLTARKALFERAAARLREYVRWTIQSMGQDEKGKFKKLEGHTVTFSLRKLPDTLEVADPAKVPSEYKSLTIEVPQMAWEKYIRENGDAILPAIINTEVKLDRRRLLAALKEGLELPGADIRLGDYGLTMR
jgi:hypothetical protein